MVDPERLHTLLDRLREETAQLRELSKQPDNELLNDRISLAAVKYGFVLTIEICIDVGEHVISSEGFRAPESFADVFAVLEEAGTLPAELAASLQDMARFRNLLVHQYLDVEDRRVVEILKSRLDDLDGFRKEIAKAVTG